MWWQRKTNQLAVIYTLSILFIVAGVVFDNFLYPVVLMFLVLTAYFLVKKKVIIAVVCLFFTICFFRGANSLVFMKQTVVAESGSYGEFFGVVVDEPVIKTSKGVIVVSLNKAIINNSQKEITEKVQVETDRFINLRFGDNISFKCKILPAKNFDGSWQMWLVKDGITSKCANAKIVKISQEKKVKYLFLNILIKIKQSATAVVNKILPEPYSSLLAGILWGARAGLPDNLQQTMKSAGITHIIAISGFNISLITVALNGWLILIGLSRKKSAIVTGLILFVFVIITGASASVIRAAVMSGFVVLIKNVQRQPRALVILPLALLMMSLANPLALLYDAGLHLSFLATVGLMSVNPQIEKILPQKFPLLLKESMVTTISATLMTGPYCWWQFGQFTLAGLISNLFVVPLVPWVMVFGAMALVFGYVSTVLALPWAFVVKTIMSSILWIAEQTSKIPSL